MAASTPEFDIICEIVGLELSRQIQDRVGGCQIYIPKDRKKRRDAEIVADYAFGGGLSVNQLVIKYDLSETQVRVIIRSASKIPKNSS